MANLLSQNIGTNYKSILNLDATTINTPLDTTLRSVTDGMGTSSPLQLSTDQVGLIRTINLSPGATNPRLFNEVYTINNAGAQTGTLTGIFLNATEIALNGMTHNLMDLQRNGSTQFRVDRTGYGFFTGGLSQVPEIGLSSSGILLFAGRIRIKSATSSTVMFQDSTESSSANIILGLQTNLFPMIKRNSTAIDFRLADDSGFCNISAASIISNNTVRLKSYTVATLPVGTQGDTAFVTDALSPSILSTVVGGGANVVTVFYNGTNWIVQ
jgi:hypothetical protein